MHIELTKLLKWHVASISKRNIISFLFEVLSKKWYISSENERLRNCLANRWNSLWLLLQYRLGIKWSSTLYCGDKFCNQGVTKYANDFVDHSYSTEIPFWIVYCGYCISRLCLNFLMFCKSEISVQDKFFVFYKLFW